MASGAQATGALAESTNTTLGWLEGGLFALAAVLMIFAVLAPRDRDRLRRTMRSDVAEGLRYFWGHARLRTLGIFLGLLNLSSAPAVSTQVLFAQTVLGLDATRFELLFLAGGIGAMAGAWLTSTLERRWGARRVLLISLGGNAVTSLAIGLAGNVLVVAFAIAGGGMLSTVWNVLTVSYRQRIVPAEMLGRVNSIYRPLAWGPFVVPAGRSGPCGGSAACPATGAARRCPRTRSAGRS